MPATKVAITGAAGQIGYSIVPLIARGNLLGPDQHVELHLLDIEPAMKTLEGVKAELQDCAFPLLDNVVITSDPKVAFSGVSFAILCGAFPRKDGMERKDLLEMNKKIFSAQGAAMAEVATDDCRVLVVGNPANTNALILLKSSNGKLKPRNVTAMTRLDHNRSLSLLAEKAGVHVKEVRNAIIWGNHSSTQVPDVNSATIDGKPARETLKDDAFLDGPFMKQVQQRGGEIIKLRGLSSAMSAAKAAVDHVHDWVLGTAEGRTSPWACTPPATRTGFRTI
ncbi:malate dehydrogenase [Angomonas deanei]|nr:malate dehydrogenase [Angomonas deanei]|eukprot:EPY34839.1 malate dehydrogenase [Angomonas deanei]